MALLTSSTNLPSTYFVGSSLTERQLKLDSAKEGATFTDYELLSYMLVFPKELLARKEEAYGVGTWTARTIDYSENIGRATKIRIKHGKNGDEVFYAKFGKKWFLVDYHRCAYVNQACIYV